uniref:Chitinase 3 n=1 Tax=Hirondellea gigas TaxID=1518452 RepID=A0A2P2HXD2_9CRUS
MDHVRVKRNYFQWLNLLFVGWLMISKSGASADENCSNPRKFVVCYYGAWATYRTGNGKFDIKDIDASLCTHINYAFATLNNQSYEMESHDSYYDVDRRGYLNFTDLKQNNTKLQTMLALGGWTDSNDGTNKYAVMVADASKRKNFIDKAVTFLRKYNFDGLDIDWEYPTDKANFAVLITELRTVFDNYNLTLSIAMGAGKKHIKSAYDFSVLCEHLDFINVMTYDFHGPWESVTNHHTNIKNLRRTYRLLKRRGGCIDRMVVGMAAYARTFQLTDPAKNSTGAPCSGAGDAGPFTQEKGFLAYNELCESKYSDYNKKYDKAAKTNYLVKGNQWITYDDRATIRIKSGWAARKGFLGAMIWALDLDDFRDECGAGHFPLLKAINRKMRPG